MVAVLLIMVGLFGSLTVWLVAIRPYSLRHRQGYTPGASFGVTAWVDWEQARAIARDRRDPAMQWICRLFISLKAAMVMGSLILLFFGRS